MTDLPGWVGIDADVPLEKINTDGVVSVGEINTRLMREAITEADYTEAICAGLTTAYRESIAYAQERIDRAGPYDDTRALQDLVVWLGDKIRSAHDNATKRNENG